MSSQPITSSAFTNSNGYDLSSLFNNSQLQVTGHGRGKADLHLIVRWLNACLVCGFIKEKLADSRIGRSGLLFF